MEVDIAIDCITPCLVERATGNVLKTELSTISLSDVKKLRGWNFDWTLPFKEGFTVKALKLSNSKQIEGLIAYKAVPTSCTVLVDIVESAPHNIGSNGKYDGVGGHLFAIAIDESFKQGFEGHIYFVAKTALIDYYSKELGAQLVNPRLRTMEIADENAKRLHDIYFGEDNSDG